MSDPELPRRFLSRRQRHELGALLVLGLGLTSLLGELTGIRALRGVGAASGASPLPKVFSAHGGIETFAWELSLLYELEGRAVRVPLTPELGAKIRGPYNRRNVYGAVLSYGPLLPADLRRSVARVALDPESGLLRDLGVPSCAKEVRVELRSKTEGEGRVWILTAEDCQELRLPPVTPRPRREEGS